MNSRIHYNDLQPGDLLLFYNNEHQYYIHAAVVASKNHDGIRYTLHGVFKPSHHMHYKQPYSVEGLAAINREMHAFRIADPIIRNRVINTMETWASYAVKFDHARLDKALIKTREMLNVQWDYSKKQFPAMSSVSTDTRAEAVAGIHAAFKIDDAIKYAARRDTSPVKPHMNAELDHGFQCQMFMLAALQAAYLADDVPSVKSEWTSLRHSMFANPVALCANHHNSSTDEVRIRLTQKIPPALRLSLDYCEPEIFYHAIKDSDIITKLGKIEPLLDAQIPEVMKDDEQALRFIADGTNCKSELRKRFNM